MEEIWRDAAEPEKLARYLHDDIRILGLEMFAQDLGHGVARLGVRGNLGNISPKERLVKLRIELVNSGEVGVSISIPLEVEIERKSSSTPSTSPLPISKRARRPACALR